MPSEIPAAEQTLAGWIKAGYPRQVRDAAGLSQQEIAGEVGCSAATIVRWETGRNHPRGAYAVLYRSVLQQLAARTGLPPPEPDGRS